MARLVIENFSMGLITNPDMITLAITDQDDDRNKYALPFSTEGATNLRDKLTEALSGIEVAREMPDGSA